MRNGQSSTSRSLGGLTPILCAVCVCVRACVRVCRCVHACVRARMRACVCACTPTRAPTAPDAPTHEPIALLQLQRPSPHGAPCSFEMFHSTPTANADDLCRSEGLLSRVSPRPSRRCPPIRSSPSTFAVGMPRNIPALCLRPHVQAMTSAHLLGASRAELGHRSPARIPASMRASVCGSPN